MKKLLRYLLFLLLSTSLFISCTEDEETFVEIAEIKVEKVHSDGAEISWTVINPENTALTFDIYINSKLIQENVTEKSIKISKLKSNTAYSGKIIVKANNRVSPEKIFTFKTADAPVPSAFEIYSSDITTDSAVIKWTKSTVKDSSKVTYFLYKKDTLEAGDLTDTTYTLKGLTVADKYNIKIVALSSNGKEISNNIIFKTLDFESPTAFEVTVSDIKPNSAFVSWTESTIKDKSNITYSIYINDKLIKENTTERTYPLKDLLATEKYQVKIVAISDKGKKTIKQTTFTSPDYPNPSEFNISTNNITSKSAVLSWTEPTVQDNSTITYEVYLNNKLIRTELTERVYTLKNLTSSKSYYVKVIAKTSNGKETSSETTLLTLNTPTPSDFTLSITSSDNDPKNTEISWTPSTITDKDAKISYQILLNQDLITTVNDTINNYVFSNLAEGTTYKVRIIAVADNGTQTKSNEILLTTITYPIITNFTLNKTVNNNTATINWTKATLDGTNASYEIKINDGAYVATDELSYTYNNLPVGDYTVEVIAKGAYKDDFIKEVKTITFTITQSYSVHPTISIQKATLYNKNSARFAGQLSVRFTENISGVSISAFYIANFTVNNFSTYTSSILSGKLSDARYTAVENNKKGYILLKDGGTTYKIPFEVVIE